ncbi:transcriptional repressor CTCF-like isoform X2 [Sitophilus oryzae]|uniref:Transcriptional repressor CTCF-like isoform X2 n=1 Tax=Sitophilus oryzae TaxID=7048 RepID=A0A6J2XSW2_SITOR|nr:transcriptional repressor CTCF-like isoform X2 [Sitophilus oryzae]
MDNKDEVIDLNPTDTAFLALGVIQPYHIVMLKSHRENESISLEHVKQENMNGSSDNKYELPTDTAFNNESISVEHVKQENISEENINGSSDNKFELPTDTAFNNESISVEHVKQENISEENINGSSDNKFELPTDTAFNNESISVEHVKQENISEENIKSSDNKFELPTDTAFNNESISVEHVKQENISEENINGSSDNKIELSQKAEKKVWRCDMCGYQSLKRSNLYQHKKIHLAPEKRKIFACIDCDKKYTTKQMLQCHLEDYHTDPRSKDGRKNIHKCSICGYQTRNISYFKTHKQIHLAPEERTLFACIHCDKKYKTKPALKLHITANHIDSRSKDEQKNIHKCSICSYQTRNITCLKQHKRVHLALEERKLFDCVMCDKKYTTKQMLQRHFNHNHIDSGKPTKPKLFACIRCDKKYALKQSLQRHLKYNHIDSRSKDGQKNIHKCSICGYQTQNISYFNQHKKVHLAREERQWFPCAQCHKKYTSNQSLQDHIEGSHIDSRNADCISPTDEVMLDSIKIEIDDDALPMDDLKNAECLSATSEIKSEHFFKIDPDDVAPVLNNDMHVDLNAECLSATNEVKSEHFFKTEPDDVTPFLNNDMHDDFKYVFLMVQRIQEIRNICV